MNSALHARGTEGLPASSQRTILLVDDDAGILGALAPTLASYGYAVESASDGQEALATFDQVRPDLVLLDLMLPLLDGSEVCRRIRAQAPTPIVVLSVKGSEADIVSVLDLGADDYLVKPFRLAELLARIRAVLRRREPGAGAAISCGDLQIDTQSHRVAVSGRLIVLTPTEYSVLHELACHVGRVVTTRQIIQNVWGPQYSDATDYVKGVVRRLRVKIEPDPAHPRYLLTEPHMGYRLNDQP
ncbi:response regulator transcription factor [Chloroflexales bacterium ZM16-3]|nr:response regulator transcription factor [Chloroflexales bacterium ZM16-3]